MSMFLTYAAGFISAALLFIILIIYILYRVCVKIGKDKATEQRINILKQPEETSQNQCVRNVDNADMSLPDVPIHKSELAINSSDNEKSLPFGAYSDKTENQASAFKIDVFVTSKLRTVVDAAEEENLRMLILDRLEEIEEEEDDIERQVLKAVDLLDEILQMRNAYADENARVLDALTQEIKQQLSDLACEILDSDVWQPLVQKAVKIEYILPDGEPPVVFQKLISGVKKNGVVLRKQSVVLHKSKVII